MIRRFWRWLLSKFLKPKVELRLPELTDKELKDAIDANKRHFPSPEEMEGKEVFLDPGRHAPGYQPQWGATIYPGSEVMKPYVGSADEEADAQKRLKPGAGYTPVKMGNKTCPNCHGWGNFGSEAFQCPLCNGAGTIK